MARPRRKQSEAEAAKLNLSDMAKILAESIQKQASEPNLYGYDPAVKQVEFHSAESTGRLYLGGNRSGKTTAGVVEDLWWLSRKHPYRRIPSDTVIKGRVVGVDFTTGIEQILLPTFKRWILPSMLINSSWEDSWNRELRTLTLENGSFVEFKSYDQDLDKHAGTSRHFIHFDEEPPRAVYVENLLRIVDTNGCYWMTMTPVEGMTWVYDDMFLPWQTGKSQNLSVIEVSMSDNKHLSEEAKSNILSALNEDERKTREHGAFVQRGGLVYNDFKDTVHGSVHTGWLPPKDENWMIYTSVDHGFNNATAWLWHAVNPEGEIITFKEHYESRMIIADHARFVLAYEKEHGLDVSVRTGDPAMRQASGITGDNILAEYARHGVYIGVEGVPRAVSIGVDKINRYLRTNPKTGRPWWRVSQSCPNLIREMKRLHWETFQSNKATDRSNPKEIIAKKDDHACDSFRYFMTLMPDLAPDEVVVTSTEPKPFRTYLDSLLELHGLVDPTIPDDVHRPLSDSDIWGETRRSFSLASEDNYEGL